MTYQKSLGLILSLSIATAFAAACGDEDVDANPGRRNADATDDAGGAIEPPPGGDLPDEQFPPSLLSPYTGPPIDDYDNTTLSYTQIRSRVKQLFADDGIGGGTDAYLASKITLLGGADFKTTYTEARVATPDFLLALDGIAKDACDRAATNKTGPFAGADPATATEAALIPQLYTKLLLRAPTAEEVTGTTGLLNQLKPLSPSTTSAWAGVCEALVRHPDFVFTLPPSVTSLQGAEKEKMQAIKLGLDFMGRLPNDGELAALAGKSIPEKIDILVKTPEFRDYYFHRARVRTESLGEPISDEPARLWTFLATTGAPMQELLTSDYTIDVNFQKAGRPAEHGKSGILTMPGFVKTKPGLPHYNYAARVMADFMGQLFEVTPEIIAARSIDHTASSTVAPGSLCITCHGVLTPLEHQRLKWADDGTYRDKDENGAPIDDSDRNLVPDYPYKGVGMEGFAKLAVRKERYFRQAFQAQFLFFLGRQMRYSEDERTVYLALWNSAWKQNGDIREQLKILAAIPRYLGN